MQIFNRLKKSAPILIGILILWVGLFFYANILNMSDKKISKLVPQDANFVFQLNVKNFIKSSTYSLLFNSKDQDLLNAFENYLNKKRKGTGRSDDFGIDFMQNLTIYGQKIEQGQIYVMLFNLVNKKKFEKNIAHFLLDNQSYTRMDDIGMIITYFGKEKLSKKELNKIVMKTAGEKYHSPLVFSETSFFDLDLNGFIVNEDIQIKTGTITSEVNDRTLNVEGKFISKTPETGGANWSLISGGLHIENALISRAMQDSIYKYIQKIGVSLYQLKRISMNYYGVEIQDTDKGIVLAPRFDLLITFKNTFSLDKIFSKPDKMVEFGLTRKGNVIQAGKLSYYIDSLDQHTLFIGRNPNQVVKRKNQILFSVNGDVSNLTKLKGGGFISSFVELLPPFRASKNLFEQIEFIDIKASQNHTNVRVKGGFRFKQNAYLYNEFLRCYLTLKGEL